MLSIYKISVVLPVYNNALELAVLYERLTMVMTGNKYDYGLIFVDDKSADDSLEIIRGLAEKDDRVTVISLTCNCGQHNAIAAGLDYAEADMVVVMDADLQDRPEDIPVLLDKLAESGVSMAIAKTNFSGDGIVKRLASKVFNAISNRLTVLKMEVNLRNFRVIRKEALEKVKPFAEKNAPPLSFLHYSGIDYVTVELPRDVRYAGKSAYTLNKMLKLSFNRIFAYGKYPLKILTASLLTMGIILLILGISLAVWGGNWERIMGMILTFISAGMVYGGIMGMIFLREFEKGKNGVKYEIDEIFHHKDTKCTKQHKG